MQHFAKTSTHYFNERFRIKEFGVTAVLKCLQKYTEVPYDKLTKSIYQRDSTIVVTDLIEVLEKQKYQTPLLYYVDIHAAGYLQRLVYVVNLLLFDGELYCLGEFWWRIVFLRWITGGELYFWREF